MSSITIQAEPVEIDVICDTCKSALGADLNPRSGVVRVEPCEQCMESAAEEARNENR